MVQQDTYIEDQKVLLTERAFSRGSFRASSLVEQEKQRSLERQRQELANLQKQQAQHQEEKRRRERAWEAREKALAEREAQLALREELAQQGLCSLEKEREELRQKKAAYQLDLEHLRAAQKQLEKEQEQMQRDMEQVSPLQAGPGLCLVRAVSPLCRLPTPVQQGVGPRLRATTTTALPALVRGAGHNWASPLPEDWAAWTNCLPVVHQSGPLGVGPECLHLSTRCAGAPVPGSLWQSRCRYTQ